jgi:hypothetical protein
MLTKKDIYKLEMHETTVVDDCSLFTTVMRVPHGWIYRSYDKSSNILSSVFVPFATKELGF